MKILDATATLTEIVASGRVSADAEVAALVDLVRAEPAPHAVSQAAVEFCGSVFKAVADHPDWNLVATRASELFDVLVRVPSILVSYRTGTPVEEIASKYEISRSGLYELLSAHGVKADRSRPGRSRSISYAAVRLEAVLGSSSTEIAARHGCTPRTVQRILSKPTSPIQPWVDDLAEAVDGEPLRGAWNRLLDTLAGLGEALSEIAEPEWPPCRDRRALAAAAIAYRLEEHGHALLPWLLNPSLVASEVTAAVPAYIPITWPITPPVVARFNVAVDEPSLHAV